MTPWNELLANLAIVAIATSVWTTGQRHLATRSSACQQLVFGLVMSAATLLVMLMPFHFSPGVYLDLRYTLLAISGFFGGPLAAVTPLAVALVKRVAAGGAGLWVAIPHILLAVSFGLIGHYRIKTKQSNAAILKLAIAVVFSGTVGFFFALPLHLWGQVLLQVIAPFGLILFVATFFSGFALSEEIKRQALANENWTYRAVIEALPDCLNAKDMDGKFIAANPATADLMGAKDVAALMGKSDFDFYPQETAKIFRDDEMKLLAAGEPITVEQRFENNDGSQAWLSTLKAPFRDNAGNVVGIITHNREITHQKELELKLAEAQGHLTNAMASMADALSMFDKDGKLLFSNKRYLDMFHKTAAVRVAGASLENILTASIEAGEIVRFADGRAPTLDALLDRDQQQLLLDDGRWIEVRKMPTSPDGFMFVYSDITGRKEYEDRLEQLNDKLAMLANTDGLTELLNRRAFDLALTKAIADARGHDTDVGLMMIDVDHFKSFNDRYGHPAGDECLRRIAAEIRKTVDPFVGSVTARYGGEEIAVILPGLNADEAFNMAQLVCSAVRMLALPHEASPRGVATISIGTAALKQGMKRNADILKRADEALYHAKVGGRDRVRSFGDTAQSKLLGTDR